MSGIYLSQAEIAQNEFKRQAKVMALKRLIVVGGVGKNYFLKILRQMLRHYQIRAITEQPWCQPKKRPGEANAKVFEITDPDAFMEVLHGFGAVSYEEMVEILTEHTLGLIG
jgi:hypothetical protein